LDSIRFDWKQFDSDNFWEATSRGHGLASATAPAPRAGVATGRDDEALQELIDVRKKGSTRSQRLCSKQSWHGSQTSLGRFFGNCLVLL
jgi:hypothetical protein